LGPKILTELDQTVGRTYHQLSNNVLLLKIGALVEKIELVKISDYMNH
jgi:hypothetical protein